MAACRAVVLATLWPDPADTQCPPKFRTTAAREMAAFRDRRGGKPRDLDVPLEVRAALLDFIAEFSDWDNSNNPDFIDVSQRLVAVAHEGLSGIQGTVPTVLDPFADKMGGALVVSALTYVGKLPVWFIAIVVVRDLLIILGGEIIRRRTGEIGMSLLSGNCT